VTYTSDRPLSVDGVRLDTLAFNILAIQRATAGRRAADLEVPGVDGVLPSLNDPLNAATLGLQMLVRGTDADGLVPPAGAAETFQDNLDELVHLFGKRHALLDLQQTQADGTVRRAWAKVLDAIAPEMNQPGSAAQFSVGLSLPYGVWEDVAATDWAGAAGAASGTAQEVTTLRGATERIQDAVVLVQGPVTNPRLTDPATGAYVQLNQTLVGTSLWRVNVGTWASRYGAGLGLGSADTTGTSGAAATVYGGTRRQTAFLPLVPVREAGERRVKIALSGGGMTAATQVSVRARRKFAL
jgi:hypothetical protein